MNKTPLQQLEEVAVMAKSHVAGYARKDGAFVTEHDDKRQAATPKTGSASKAKITNIGTAKWPMHAKTSERLDKQHHDGSTHHVGGFVPPVPGANGDHSIQHDGKSYFHTGKSGKHMQTGEDAYEFRHSGDDDRPTDQRVWVTKTGHLMND